MNYYEKVFEFERDLLTKALVKSKTISEAAIKLGLKRSTIQEKMRILRISIEKKKGKIFKVVCFSILIGFLQACSSSSNHTSHHTATTVEPVTPREIVGVTLSPVKYYTTPEQRVKIARVEVKLNTTVKSDCVYNFISQRDLIQTGGKMPVEVAKHTQGLSGTVPVKMYYRRFTSAVAYQQPPSLTINLNTKYFTTELSDCEWASTIAHEAIGHALGGYSHDFYWNAQRDFSVPYSIGKAVEACCHD